MTLAWQHSLDYVDMRIRLPLTLAKGALLEICLHTTQSWFV